MTLEIDLIRQLAPLDLPWEGTAAVIIHRGWRDPGQDPVHGIARRWEFPIEGPGEARTLAVRSFLGLGPDEAALRWFPRRGKLRDLVPILEIVAESGCGLTLPNRPAGVITSEAREAFPDKGELAGDVLSELRALTGVLSSERVRMHDFILTQALGKEGVEPMGCEAGNSIAFIDADGKVYPCETLMVAMGDLRNETLDAVWSSPMKERIRKDVGSVPGLCSSCPDLPRCRGGCRGAVYHLSGHYGAPDPLCPADTEIDYE